MLQGVDKKVARILVPADRPPGIDQPEAADQKGRDRQAEIVGAGIAHDMRLAQKLAFHGGDGALEARVVGFDDAKVGQQQHAGVEVVRPEGGGKGLALLVPGALQQCMVDGLTRFGAFVKLVIPISVSGILTVVIFTFTLVTQEFVYALTFISSESNQMIGTGIPIFLVRGDVYYWGALMAACLIGSLPIAFMYNLFLDRFIAGFTVGAVK